nr:hypothetical protein [Pasteurella multocida]
MKSVYFFLPFVCASFSLNAANTSIPMLDKSYQESSQQQEEPIFTCRTNQGKIIQLNKYDKSISIALVQILIIQNLH